MFRPSDLQLVLLHAAATRADGSLLPPPDSIGGQAVRIRQSIAPLLAEGLVDERPVSDPRSAWRYDQAGAYGAFITPAGRAIVGCGVSERDHRSDSRRSKTALITRMLEREQGASLAELTSATGWQAHSARAALSKLKARPTLPKSDATAGPARYRIEA